MGCLETRPEQVGNLWSIGDGVGTSSFPHRNFYFSTEDTSIDSSTNDTCTDS